MKKHRVKKSRAVVASTISDNLEHTNQKSEPASTAAAKGREAAAAKPPAGKLRKWAQQVVLGYDRSS